MSDWYDDPEVLRYLHRAEREVLPMVEGSAITICLNPGDKPDAKSALELGFMILLDKPIITISLPGRPVSDRLRRVSDVVLEGDPADPAVQEQLHTAIRKAMGETL